MQLAVLYTSIVIYLYGLYSVYIVALIRWCQFTAGIAERVELDPVGRDLVHVVCALCRSVVCAVGRSTQIIQTLNYIIFHIN